MIELKLINEKPDLLSLAVVKLFARISELPGIERAQIPQKRGFKAAIQECRCRKLLERIKDLSGASSRREAFRAAHARYETAIQRAPLDLMLWGCDVLQRSLNGEEISSGKVSTAIEILEELYVLINENNPAACARYEAIALDLERALRDSHPEYFEPDRWASTTTN